MKRGQIVWVNQSRARASLGSASGALDKTKTSRPYLVVHSPHVPRFFQNFVCVEITSQIKNANVAWRVLLRAGSCLPSQRGEIVPGKDSYVDCSQIHTFPDNCVETSRRDGGIWGVVPDPLMDEVDKALINALYLG